MAAAAPDLKSSAIQFQQERVRIISQKIPEEVLVQITGSNWVIPNQSL